MISFKVPVIGVHSNIGCS